jgi:hypothetical protein
MQNPVAFRKSRVPIVSEPDDFARALDRLGSMPLLAADLSLPESTVYAWRRRNSIPVAYWEPIERFARANGVRTVSYERFRQYEAARWIARQAKRTMGEQRDALPSAAKS